MQQETSPTYAVRTRQLLAPELWGGASHMIMMIAALISVSNTEGPN